MESIQLAEPPAGCLVDEPRRGRAASAVDPHTAARPPRQRGTGRARGWDPAEPVSAPPSPPPQRLQVERGEAALAGAPGRPPLEQLRPGERDHEDRRSARPVQQVLDEIEQRAVCPLQILEREHHRVRCRPGARRTVARPRTGPAGRGCARPARAAAPAAAPRTPAPPDRADARPASRAAFSAPCPAARPRRSGSASAPCPPAPNRPHPPRRRGNARGASTSSDAVEVLVELPRQPRLADPGDPGHRHQVAPGLPPRLEENLICRSSRSRPTNGASSPAT